MEFLKQILIVGLVSAFLMYASSKSAKTISQYAKGITHLQMPKLYAIIGWLTTGIGLTLAIMALASGDEDA